MDRTLRFVPLLAVFLLAAVLLQPAAAERVLYSEPLLTASLAGDNTFEPGEERFVTIVIANAGVENEVENPLLPPVHDSDPLTARGVSISLDAAGTPFTVKSDRCLLGDILPGEELTAEVLLQADDRAAPEAYNLRLRADYGFVAWTTVYPDDIRYYYDDRAAELAIPVRVEGRVRPEVLSVEAENLAPGHTGTVVITFENTGSGEGTSCAADLVVPGLSIRPTDGGNLIEEIVPGGVYTVSLRAEVEKDAPAGLTPADFAVLYRDDTGAETVSRMVRIGVPVGAGPQFSIVSPPPVFCPGDTREIAVTFRNTGDAPASGAKVRINAMDPFSAAVSSAELGDIAPGEEKAATFTLTMAGDAPVRPYGYTAVLKYYDESGTLILADPMQVAIAAAEENPAKALVTNPVFLVVVAGMLILGLYFFRFRD